MAGVAVLRGFYLFTDRLVNLAHYPWLNLPLSVGTGILLSVASELTITIAGRRHKRFKAQLFNARLAHASATGKHQPIWAVEVERLTEQVSANQWAMRVSMAMSLLSAASYLIDSTGAASVLAFVVAVALAGYTLFLMYFHGVQTEAIHDDGTAETAAALRDALHRIRLEETVRLRTLLQEATVSPSARLALIASGLPIPDQRQVLPILRLLLRVEEHTETDSTAVWLTMRDVALRAGDDLVGRKADDVARKYRRRCSDNAHKHPETIRLDAGRGWIVEPDFAVTFFHLPPERAAASEAAWPSSLIVEAVAS
jgi:hypothetical protein